MLAHRALQKVLAERAQSGAPRPPPLRSASKRRAHGLPGGRHPQQIAPSNSRSVAGGRRRRGQGRGRPAMRPIGNIKTVIRVRESFPNDWEFNQPKTPKVVSRNEMVCHRAKGPSGATSSWRLYGFLAFLRSCRSEECGLEVGKSPSHPKKCLWAYQSGSLRTDSTLR